MSSFQMNQAGIFLPLCIGRGRFFQFPHFLSPSPSLFFSPTHSFFVRESRSKVNPYKSCQMLDQVISKSSFCKYNDTADVCWHQLNADVVDINGLTDWLLNRHLDNWSPVSKILLQNQACPASQAPVSINDTADVLEINRLTDWPLDRHLGNWSPVSKTLLQNQACRASQASVSIDDTADVPEINGLIELTTG